METEITQEFLSRLSAFVARKTGLHFSPDRWPELRRSIAAAASDLGFSENAAACERWLAEAPPLTRSQFETLVAHLTVGETYFFRERRHFDFLAAQILPQIVSRGDRQLRIWSAGCCTGEEAYSIAIVLRRMVPDLENWKLTLLATDINPRFLQKAQAGVFGSWSFRDVPAGLQAQYFRARPDGQFEVLPEIRRMVRFVPLNFAEDTYPSFSNDTYEMDVIFCRNVLMYFSRSQALKVVENLHHVQREGGWLFVGASELLHLSGLPYTTVNAPEMVVHRKVFREPLAPQRPANPVPPVLVVSPRAEIPAAMAVRIDPDVPIAPTVPDPLKKAGDLYARGCYQDAADILRTYTSDSPPEHAAAAAFALLARCLANQGQLTEALGCCDQSLAADKCNAASLYLRAQILREQGAVDDAIRSLRSALYLDPHFVLAHVAMGTLERQRRRMPAADKHFRHALELLGLMAADAALPESDGVTAGQLVTMIHSLMHQEAVP